LQLAVFDVQDAGAEGVQEFAVVRDDDLCRRVGFEVVLQPDDGVKVEVGEKEAAVDLYIIVQYGIRIPEVALAAQENVKRAIETMTGLTVVEVNVHVQGVGFPEEEPKTEEARVR